MPYASFDASMLLRMSVWKFFSQRYMRVLMGMGGSMLNTWTSEPPSLLARLPENTARPFGGVCLMSLRCWIIFSSASMTLLRVDVLLMLVAVPCSWAKCWMILLRS